jgi:hypothetical protein
MPITSLPKPADLADFTAEEQLLARDFIAGIRAQPHDIPRYGGIICEVHDRRIGKVKVLKYAGREESGK